MFNRKWLLTLVVSIYLLIPCATLAQTNKRLGRTIIPQREIVGVVSVLPRDGNEFQNVYKREPTPTQANDIKRTQRRLARLNRPSLEFHPEARTSIGFESYVRQAKEKTIMLVGHNEEGEFRFADGVALPLKKIDAFLKDHNKQVIVLSCEANGYLPPGSPAATGTLTNRDAIRMIDLIGKDPGRDTSLIGDTLNLGGDFTSRVQANINRVERLSRIESYFLKPTAAITGAVGTGIAGYAIERKVRTKRR